MKQLVHVVGAPPSFCAPPPAGCRLVVLEARFAGGGGAAGDDGPLGAADDSPDMVSGGG